MYTCNKSFTIGIFDHFANGVSGQEEQYAVVEISFAVLTIDNMANVCKNTYEIIQ